MMQTDIQTDHPRKRPGVRKALRHNLRIDMTPMVDLGFLLISFFVITTELTKPRAMELFMPADKGESELGNSYALTVIVDKDKHYYYHGDWDKAKAAGEIFPFANAEELRAVIAQKLMKLDNRAIYKEGRDGMMLLLKPSALSNYKTVVDVLDEVAIGDVKKHAILKLSEEETEWLEANR